MRWIKFNRSTWAMLATFVTSLSLGISMHAAPLYGGNWIGWTNAINTNSFTQGPGTNQILIVRVLLDISTATTSNTVTFNGVPMTLLRVDNAANATYPPAFIYYLLNPSVGTFNIIVNPNPVSAGWRRVEAFSYSDVDQTTPFGAQNAVSAADAAAPFISTNPFTPTSTNSTVVELNWWQGAAASSGFSTNLGTVRAQAGPSGGAWHSTGMADWNPGALSAVSIVQTWASGWGDHATSQIFELMPASPPPTPTPTPGPITLVKTANVAVANVGDTITFCMTWSNGDNVTHPFTIWDTVPSTLTYMGCNTGCTVSGSVVNWNLGVKGVGTSGTVCFWGTANAVP